MSTHEVMLTPWEIVTLMQTKAALIATHLSSVGDPGSIDFNGIRDGLIRIDALSGALRELLAARVRNETSEESAASTEAVA